MSFDTPILKPVCNIGSVKMCGRGHVFTDTKLELCDKCVLYKTKTLQRKAEKEKLTANISKIEKELPISLSNLFYLNDFQTSIVLKQNGKTLTLTLELKTD